jgi:tetratricopeptide (TPR) repeat protein
LPQKQKAAVDKALQLDPTLAEARTVLAGVKHADWDWSGAGVEYRHAIELNPNYAHAHHWYSQYLCEQGKFDEGVAEADRAHTLDPLNLMLGIDVGSTERTQSLGGVSLAMPQDVAEMARISRRPSRLVPRNAQVSTNRRALPDGNPSLI